MILMICVAKLQSSAPQLRQPDPYIHAQTPQRLHDLEWLPREHFSSEYLLVASDFSIFENTCTCSRCGICSVLEYSLVTSTARLINLAGA
jgi:hypothetical protein